MNFMLDFTPRASFIRKWSSFEEVRRRKSVITKCGAALMYYQFSLQNGGGSTAILMTVALSTTGIIIIIDKILAVPSKVVF